jgi:DNA ligase (NAD+)
VEIAKMNLIIPQIVANHTQSNSIVPPSECPVCGAPTEIKQDNTAKVLMCAGEDCSGKILSKFVHFVGKSAMDIEGLSEATLERFIDAGFLEAFADIYKLNGYRDEIVRMDGFGVRSYEKLWDAIERSRNTTLARFLVSLGIHTIGRTASKAISKQFGGDRSEFMAAVAGDYDFTQLQDFGATMNTAIREYFGTFKNHKWYVELIKELNFEEEIQPMSNTESKISGLTFVVTGSVEHYKNRDELKAEIESLGGTVAGSVSAKTSYLLTNDTTSGTSKNRKAQELGVPIITENEYRAMAGLA